MSSKHPTSIATYGVFGTFGSGVVGRIAVEALGRVVAGKRGEGVVAGGSGGGLDGCREGHRCFDFGDDEFWCWDVVLLDDGFAN